ncbi:Lysosome-associated membrane glycoprotein 3 [Channa argus]|uniref:Lysosome-associated membrane glycoprotein 3 n=1 Tax=Channa argus TaxID=215402 RepID=A0A6G1PK02_CHAAH|nr:Lysosome-associated membrane glycoprotein 3 [Channa argus]KAK2908177.1 hypothetical protein Q8A73_009250 [Channa argus]
MSFISTTMLNGHTGVCLLVLLAALIPGIHLQPASEMHSDSQVYQPVLQPSETIPPIGTYTLKSSEGKPCIKATMGVEYIVTEKQKTWYFNVDPSRVVITGHCGKDSAVLSLQLPDNAAGLEFTFTKEKKRSYVSKLTAQLSPRPVCQKCGNETYSGLLDHQKLFTAEDGSSFGCRSENLLRVSSQLKIKLVPLQMQAFTLPSGQFGQMVECWADYSKDVIPIIIGATVVGLILIAMLTFLFIKDRRRQGYDRI